MNTSSNFLSAQRPDQHPSVPSLIDDNNRAILVQAIKACLVAADKPTSIRTGLRDIHCEIRGSEGTVLESHLFFTATNGHIALTVETRIPSADPCSFLVSGESARDFVRSKGYSTLLPSFDEFPDVRQVIPKTFGAPANTPPVGFSGLYLSSIGKILTALKMNRAGVGNAVSMRHNGPLSPVLFESGFMPESGDPASIRGFCLVVMPVRLQ
jgi:hypothetical protein